MCLFLCFVEMKERRIDEEPEVRVSLGSYEEVMLMERQNLLFMSLDL